MFTRRTPYDALYFTPVPSLRQRADGWTPERQHAFIAALAMLGSVGEAARSVGKSTRTAYRLRERAGAESFAAAWDEALDRGAQAARAAGIRRAIEGVEVPVIYRGKVIAKRRVYNDRLVLAALKAASIHRDRLAEQEKQRRDDELYAQQVAEADARWGPVDWDGPPRYCWPPRP